MDKNIIITLGLTEAQNETVKSSFPATGYDILIAEAFTDVIALPCMTAIINADSLNVEECDIILSYYDEVAAGLYETIYWIGYPQPSTELMNTFKCYDTFEQFAINIKYHLLEAQRRFKKSKDFSDKLADCLLILSEIRKHPGIKTKELADKLEKSTRTIGRYISALVATGEWIAYDNTAKGWYLEYGKSLLFGDVFNDTESK